MPQDRPRPDPYQRSAPGPKIDPGGTCEASDPIGFGPAPEAVHAARGPGAKVKLPSRQKTLLNELLTVFI